MKRSVEPPAPDDWFVAESHLPSGSGNVRRVVVSVVQRIVGNDSSPYPTDEGQSLTAGAIETKSFPPTKAVSCDESAIRNKAPPGGAGTHPDLSRLGRRPRAGPGPRLVLQLPEPVADAAEFFVPFGIRLLALDDLEIGLHQRRDGEGFE